MNYERYEKFSSWLLIGWLAAVVLGGGACAEADGPSLQRDDQSGADTGAVDASEAEDAASDTTSTEDAAPDGDECRPGETRSCGQMTGACETGEQTCVDGFWGDCEGGTQPTDETCNGEDADCDGTVDEGCGCQYEGNSEGVCPGQERDDNGNCQRPDDYEADESSCDGKDNDCDGSVDEGLKTTYYEDADGDGFGNPDSTLEACPQNKPSGYVSNSEDCNDNCTSCYPGAAEQCDGRDNDCDGTVDNGSGIGTIYYEDSDGDGYGNPNSTTRACDQPAGYVSNDDDCNDSCTSCNPGNNSESNCDGRDDDCDGTIDEGVKSTFYEDSDGDGYGHPNHTTTACNAPSGYVANSDDCNDGNADVNPDQTSYFEKAIDSGTGLNGRGTQGSFDYNCSGSEESQRESPWPPSDKDGGQCNCQQQVCGTYTCYGCDPAGVDPSETTEFQYLPAWKHSYSEPSSCGETGTVIQDCESDSVCSDDTGSCSADQSTEVTLKCH